jgi:hypothetical protein
LFEELAAEDVETVNRIARKDAKRWRKFFQRIPHADQPIHLSDFFPEEAVPPHITTKPDISACLLSLNNQLVTIRPLLDQLVALFDRFHAMAVAFVKRHLEHVRGHLKTVAAFRDSKMQHRLAKCGLPGQTMEAIVAEHTNQGRYLDALAGQLEDQQRLFQELGQTASRFIAGLLL